MGQAAGTGASLALQRGVAPIEVDIPSLQDRLAGDGVFLGH
jgi:hypothetical protein